MCDELWLIMSVLFERAPVTQAIVSKWLHIRWSSYAERIHGTYLPDFEKWEKSFSKQAKYIHLYQQYICSSWENQSVCSNIARS